MINRRSFLESLLAAGSTVMLGRSALGQSAPAAGAAPASSVAEQSEAVRTAAKQLLQALAPERRNRLLFPYPGRQAPTAVGFDELGGRSGSRNGSKPAGHDVAFNTDGRPVSESERRGDPGSGPRGPRPDRGPVGGAAPGGRPAAAERYGQSLWTNFPVDVVPRPGVRMGELNAVERTAVHGLLRAVLSPMGYQKVLDVMDADQVVADAGPDYAAGLDTYTIALFGKPNAADPWMLQFGGHHLGLNVTFVKDQAVCAPLHTGILPAWFEADGKVVRGLGRENDKAFGLIAMLRPEQMKAAMIDHDVSDLVCGPGRPDAKFFPEGVRGAELSEPQRTMLLSLIGEWAGVLNAFHSSERLDEIRKALPDTRFAWSGPTTHEPGREGGAYFRVHGPTLLIEHAPQPNQGGYKVHVHTVMRNLGNDYASQLV